MSEEWLGKLSPVLTQAFGSALGTLLGMVLVATFLQSAGLQYRMRLTTMGRR